MAIVELNHNIMISYKKSWNHHISGPDCWCKPTLADVAPDVQWRFHRNYEWVDDGTRYGKWMRLHEDGGTHEA